MLTCFSLCTNTFNRLIVAYFNGAMDKLSETLKVLERYQDENNSNQEPPSFLEIDQGGKLIFQNFKI